MAGHAPDQWQPVSRLPEGAGPGMIEVEAGQEFTQRRLVAQYWSPRPDSKHLVLAVLSTPLGDIPHTLLSYFDAIVEVSRFIEPIVAD